MKLLLEKRRRYKPKHTSFCYCCGLYETYIDYRGYDHWYNNYDIEKNVLCEDCNNKHIKNPIWKPITNVFRIVFLGKSIYLAWNPHKYICSKCGSVKGVDCKRTDMHHYFYVSCMPWACTFELCGRCHNKTKENLGRNQWNKDKKID
jgi:hypothetical protein